MKHLALRSSLTVAFGVALAASLSAQQTQQYYPSARIGGIQPVIESSYKWFPQIQPSFRIGKLSPANPSIPPREDGPFSGLRAGSQLLAPRSNLDAKFPGIDATGWVPPDPNLAVGPGHIVEVVNSDIAWFNKATGAKQFQVSMAPVPGPTEGFFESLNPSDFVFDPKCFYDQVSGRFFVVALELDQGGQASKALVAVSDDSDPNGVWHKYRFEAMMNVNGTPTWLDYPGFGCNKDALIVTGNQFGFSSGFYGVQVITVPKAQILSGAVASQTQTLLASSFTIQVARTPDPNLNHIYMVGEGQNRSQMRLYAVTGLPNNPVVSQTAVAIPTWFPPSVNAPSPNGRTLDSLDGRIYDADWLNGRLVAVHTPRVSQSDSRNMIRWYEFSTNGWPTMPNPPTLFQSGNVIGGSGEHYHMAGIALNSVNDMAVVFTRSSSSIVADLMVAGRKASDPPGAIGTPVLVSNSLGASYGSPGFNRWGDYFSMEVDPDDNLKFWSIGMIGKANGNWTTIINSHTISDIGTGGQFTLFPPLTASIYQDPYSNPSVQGINLQGGPGDVANSDNINLTIGSVFMPGLGQVAAGHFTYDLEGNLSALTTLRVNLEANALSTCTIFVMVKNQITGKWHSVKAFPAKPTGNAQVLVTLPAPLSQWRTSSGAMDVVIRAVNPIRSRLFVMPLAFTLSLDLVEVQARF